MLIVVAEGAEEILAYSTGVVVKVHGQARRAGGEAAHKAENATG